MWPESTFFHFHFCQSCDSRVSLNWDRGVKRTNYCGTESLNGLVVIFTENGEEVEPMAIADGRRTRLTDWHSDRWVLRSTVTCFVHRLQCPQIVLLRFGHWCDCLSAVLFFGKTGKGCWIWIVCLFKLSDFGDKWSLDERAWCYSNSCTVRTVPPVCGFKWTWLAKRSF